MANLLEGFIVTALLAPILYYFYKTQYSNSQISRLLKVQDVKRSKIQPVIGELESFEALGSPGAYIGGGPTPGVFNAVSITDPLALNYMMNRKPYGFPKPPAGSSIMECTLGYNVITAENESHRRQRAIMGPTMTQGAVNDMLPAFTNMALKLRDSWNKLIDSGEREIDIILWGQRATIDVISLCGFEHSFDALDLKANGYPDFVAALFIKFVELAFTKFSIFCYLVFPKWIAQSLIRKVNGRPFDDLRKYIGPILFDEKKHMSKAKNSFRDGDKSIIGVIMSATDAINDSKRLSRTEAIDQILGFLGAGMATSTLTISWALFKLAEDKDIQNKLRAEIIEAGIGQDDEEIDLNKLTSLPYLDAFIKEIFRCEPPISATARVAVEDCVIPFEEPVKLADGTTTDSLFLPKNTLISIPIFVFNQARKFWGPDAQEFKPERWLESGSSQDTFSRQKHKNFITPFANLMTFWGGKRGCMGYRFIVLEMKVLFSIIVANFEIGLSKDAKEGKYGRLKTVSFPFHIDRPDAYSNLALTIDRLSQD